MSFESKEIKKHINEETSWEWNHIPDHLQHDSWKNKRVEEYIMTKQEQIDWLSEVIAKPECISEMKKRLSEFDAAFIGRIYKEVKGVVDRGEQIEFELAPEGVQNETPE